MPKKPTGDIGPFVATAKNGTIEGHWDKIGFPLDKVGQEQYMTKLFVEALRRQEGLSFDIRKLPETDHDALLRNVDSEIELQLMEIVIRPKEESPYRSASRNYNSGKFADTIIEKIKTKRYAVGPRLLWFLLYSTHWAFDPPHSVLYLFHDYFNTNKHPYARVFVSRLLDSTFADVTNVYPELKGATISALQLPRNVVAARAQDYRIPDPGAVSVSGGNIVIPL